MVAQPAPPPSPRPRRGEVARRLASQLERAAKAFPAVVLTGPRRAGKTTLLRSLRPDADYRLLEEPDLVTQIRTDPRSFMESLRTPVILDEVQNVPEIFPWVRARIDAAPSRRGRYFLTGSRDFSLMEGVSESMTGRAAILRLLPLSTQETPKVTMIDGGYPEVLRRPRDRSLWFASYLQTYVERDVRSILAVRDLATFRRFLALLSTRHAQVLNRTDLAAPLGVSVPTISQWLGILETTGVIALVHPWHDHAGKRLVKSPKVYFIDSGLACHLLGIASDADLRRSPFVGSVFEGFVAAEILKAQVNAGRPPQLFWFRDRRGLEVDFVVPTPRGEAMLVEAKATRTVRPEFAAPMLRLATAMRGRGGRAPRCLVVHEGPALATRALSPGAEAVDLAGLLEVVGESR
ncbi:MAG: ATP-binding protein [Phycisphaerae bacterium]|nr:ATP-binding protein [Phycisphaerae bacterium]